MVMESNYKQLIEDKFYESYPENYKIMNQTYIACDLMCESR